MNLDQVWFNQTYFTHRDTTYSTDSTFDLGISSSTNDFKNFTTLTLNMTVIKDKKWYTCHLKYQDVSDLIMSLSEVMSNYSEIFNRNNCELYKNYGNKSIRINFKKSKTGENIVIIAIIYSESDFGVVVLNQTTFSIIYTLMKSFESEYIRLVFDIVNRSLLTSMREEITSLKRSIETLPSSIVELKDIGSQDTEIDQKVIDDQNNFDSFIQQNIDRVVIPEFHEEIKESVQNKITSFLFEKALQNDILNIDTFFSSITSSNPLPRMLDLFSRHFPDSSLENIKNIYLPSITDSEFSSLIYVSGLLYHTFFQNYLKKGESIPAIGIPVTRYMPSKIEASNIELATDLLLLVSYIKIVRDRLQPKEEDSYNNKSYLYMTLRCSTDSLIFSFLNEQNCDAIFSTCLDKFKYLKTTKFFLSFDKILSSFNCSEVTLGDIQGHLNNVKKVVVSGKNIYDYHVSGFNSGKMKLSPENQLRSEQINDFIKLEVYSKLEQDIDLDEIDPTVIKLYASKNKVKLSQNKSNVLPLISYIEKFIDEVPYEIRTEFLKYISTLHNQEFDVSKFQIESLGDNIISGLYAWQPEVDPKLLSYNYFIDKISNSKLERDLMISSMRSKVQTSPSSDEWLDGISLQLE